MTTTAKGGGRSLRSPTSESQTLLSNGLYGRASLDEKDENQVKDVVNERPGDFGVESQLFGLLFWFGRFLFVFGFVWFFPFLQEAVFLAVSPVVFVFDERDEILRIVFEFFP